MDTITSGEAVVAAPGRIAATGMSGGASVVARAPFRIVAGVTPGEEAAAVAARVQARTVAGDSLTAEVAAAVVHVLFAAGDTSEAVANLVRIVAGVIREAVAVPTRTSFALTPITTTVGRR